MKILVLSYSLTGNNEALSTAIARALGAEHISVSETKTRSNTTIVFDIMFNRVPQVSPLADKSGSYDLVILAGPVWMGHVATPLRAYLAQLKMNQGKYAFISISGGADGANPGLAAELNKRTGRDPEALLDLAIAEILPANPKPTRQDTSSYRLKEEDVRHLAEIVVKILNEKVLKPTAVMQ